MNRYPIVDKVRGLAVILMIVFHCSYDLNMLNLIKINFSGNFFWWILPRIIVFLFFLSTGISLAIGHHQKIRWKKFGLRFFKILSFSLLISATTFIIFPDRWIYFGTLHSIALCSIFILPFLNAPNLSLLICLSLFIPNILFDKDIPWFVLNHNSMDYIPPFPWLGAISLGIFLFHKNFHKLDLPIGLKPLEILGRHSLAIYLLHQPIIFSLLWIGTKLI